MKSIFVLIIFSILLISCNKQSKLEKEFDCNTNVSFENLEKVADFNKKISLKTPKKWSTKLFYNNYETTIMTADSLKSFSNTYILNVSLISGDLVLNEAFTTNIKQNLTQKENLTTTKHQFDVFKKTPSVWFLSNGKKGKYDYHYFQLFIKKNETEYLEVSTKIYGDKLVNERLCESIALMNGIEF